MIEKDLENELKFKCMYCCDGDWNEVKLFQAKETCFLHPFSFGKNPFNIRELTDEERQVLRDRLTKIRERKDNE